MKTVKSLFSQDSLITVGFRYMDDSVAKIAMKMVIQILDDAVTLGDDIKLNDALNISRDPADAETTVAVFALESGS